MKRKKIPQGRLHRTKAFPVPGLPQALPCTLYLPPDYDASKRRYPVIYAFDGQNLFEDHGTFAGGWHLNRIMDARHTLGRPTAVVVGIHHGAKRDEELSPFPVEEGKPALGEALLDWVVGPLAKMVEEDVRVLKGPEHTTLAGSSLGGLLALHGFFRHHDRFWKGLCLSPSLWVDEGAIFQSVAKAPFEGLPRLYLDCGAHEAEGIVIQHAEWMSELLVRKGFHLGRQQLWVPDPHGHHRESSWRRRLPRALRYLLDGQTR